MQCDVTVSLEPHLGSTGHKGKDASQQGGTGGNLQHRSITHTRQATAGRNLSAWRDTNSIHTELGKGLKPTTYSAAVRA